MYLMFLLMVNNWLSITPKAEMRTDTMPTHYYIEWSGKKTTDQIDTEVGTLNWEKKFPQREISEVNNLDSLLANISTELTALPSSQQNILIHIHGLWANRNPFFGEINGSLDQHILSDKSSPYGIIVHIVWDAGWIYNHSRDVAYEKGKRSKPIVDELLNMTHKVEGKLSFIIHSMGNRVFNGLIDSYDLDQRDTPLFHKSLMIAADVESTMFEEGQPYYKSDKIANEIILYRHNTDRTLGMSKLINGERLGLNGVTNYEKIQDNVRVIDVSLLNDEEFPSAKLSRHRYYYTSPTVRQDILAELVDIPLGEYKNRQAIARKNHFKLIFETSEDHDN